MSTTDPVAAQQTALSDSQALVSDSRFRKCVPIIGLVIAIIVCAIIPVIFNPHFYFYADTAEGAYGQWFELGQQLRSGSWPLLNPEAWMAGNYAAEGQWGLWNPLVLVIALAVSTASNAVVISTVVKIFFLAVGGSGVYLLARSFHSSRQWSLVAGFAAPFAGFTLFMDATSWVTNEMVWALSAWTFWAIRRHVHQGKSILMAAVCGYLLISVGYVEGTLMLVAFYAACLVEAFLRRSWLLARRTLLVGLIHGLFAITIYLPGVLTGSVTTRATGIENDGFMVLSLTGLATGSSGFGNAPLSGWWGEFTNLPLLYVAWFLPLLALASRDHARRTLLLLRPFLIFGGLATLLAVAPSQMGPLRFPARALPWVAMALLITVACFMSQSRVERPSRARLVAMLLWSGAANLLVCMSVPTRDVLKMAIVHTILYWCALAAIWWSLRRRSTDNPSGHWSTEWLRVLGVLLVSVLVLALQSLSFAGLVQSRSNYPAQSSTYEGSLSQGQGDGIIVGDALALPGDFWNETVFGNSWYLSNTDIQNVYTPVGYNAYSSDLCLLYDGRTCTQLADTLFQTDPTTEVPLVDLLSLDTVQLLVSTNTDLDTLVARQVPAGWHLANVGSQSVTWVRDKETGDAGSAVWASSGVSYQQVSNSNLTSTIHIDSVPATGGTVVFSRLDWPGYSVTGATHADATRGYLLTVDIPAGAAGTDVTITFRPPGWTAEVAAFAFAWIIAITAQGLYFWHRRRSQNSNSSDPQGKDRP